MKIFGEEYGFALTVGASAEIAELCPDGDLTRIGELLGGRYANMMNAAAAFVVAMATGYDNLHRYSGEEITHPPLTVEMLKALPSKEFTEVQSAAMACFAADSKPTVEVAESKKKDIAE
jgi:hypothetical protein